MTTDRRYDFHVMPLSDEDGSGYVARVLDLPGCMGDGDTPEAAIKDAERAMKGWVEEYEKIGREVPKPGTAFAEAKRRRAEEVKTLTELRDHIRDQEKNFEGLEDRISLIEKDIQFLIDLAENGEEWERFAIITRTTSRQRQKELFC